MRVSVIGIGYVGTVTAAGLAEIGNEVTCADLDPLKVDAVNRGKPLIHEEGIEELVSRHSGGRLRAMGDTSAAVAATNVTIITVDTPFDGQRIDLRSIERVAEAVGRALRDKREYHVVVVKSTVVPGTTDSVVLPILERESGKKAGPDFGVGMNPEFLREGSAVADFMDPDRIVLGGIDERSLTTMAEVYRGFDGVEVVMTTPRTAEMIKYTSNSLLATLISFSNEIANLASEVGVDSSDVMRGLHLDRRLSPVMGDGTRVRPGILSYIEPGCGFGGSCFPKDVKALTAFGTESGSPMKILDAVMDVNESQPERMVDLLKRQITSLNGARVVVLGAAFKPGTDDVRESPGIKIAEMLLAEGAEVTLVDPVANGMAEARLGDKVTYAESIDGAAVHPDAYLLVTAWPQFADLARIIGDREVQPVVVDGRRFLERGDFTRYEAIGL